MKSFSLEKLKHKVGRRFSDPSVLADDLDASPAERRNSLSSTMLGASDLDQDALSPAARFRATSFTLLPENPFRSGSRTVSKKHTKELIRQETAHVIQKKLRGILDSLGLQLPVLLKVNTTLSGGSLAKSVNLYVANTHNCIYLAPSLSRSMSYEDDDNGGSQVPEDVATASDASTTGARHSVSSLALATSDAQLNLTLGDSFILAANRTLKDRMQEFASKNYLCTQIDAGSSLPHLFAVIVELKREVAVKSVDVEFSSISKALWPTAETGTRHLQEEKFKIGSLKWSFSLSEADYFISSKNSNDTVVRDIDPESLAARTRFYSLFNANSTQGHAPQQAAERTSMDTTHDLATTSHSTDAAKAGLYVFLLPILLPANIPATVLTTHGTLSHKLEVNVGGVQERSLRKQTVKATHNLPMIRTPPSLANSIADKPIYVNRTWNDALHYTIAFPRKHVALGCEHTINIKLVPLAKDVVVKRIKFNILERTTYLSKDMSKEFCFDGDDPFTRSRSSKNKERIVPLCELKTKAKASSMYVEPFKEEVIKCPANNLLFSCYELQRSPSDSRDKTVMVALPLEISIALPFLTSKADQETPQACFGFPEDDSHRALSNPGSRRASHVRRGSVASEECPSSPVIGSLETHISHLNGDLLFRDSVDEDVLRLDSSSINGRNAGTRMDDVSRGYTTNARALSPDSNYVHIQVTHRLQICFRVSKLDENDYGRMHHYEVVVDTPINLLSAKCNDDSIQLPKYNEIALDGGVPAPASQPAPSLQPPPRIQFRTPSYINNGVTIRPLNTDGVEPLPSFEEAISDPQSATIFRASSVTSLDSPMGPAPSYEASIEDVVDPVATLNIDDMIASNQTMPSTRASNIRLSLQNSFAPSFTTSSLDSSQGRLNGEVELLHDAGSEVTAASSTSESSALDSQALIDSVPSASCGADSYTSALCGEADAQSDERIEGQDCDQEEEFSGDDDSNELYLYAPAATVLFGTPPISRGSFSNDTASTADAQGNESLADDAESIITAMDHGQKLSLIGNTSVDELDDELEKLRLRLQQRVTAAILSDTFGDGAQSMYHPC